MLAVVAGPLRICLGTHTVTLVGTALTLTRTEFDLLHTLVRANGRVKTRDELVEELRGRDWKLCGRAIVMHIFSLRKRLGADAKATRFIRTARGVAYMLVA